MLAEHLRHDVFSLPFRAAEQTIRLSACFGIASSHGRSPVVVLHEAEQALQDAKTAGPKPSTVVDGSFQPAPAPVAFFSPSTGETSSSRVEGACDACSSRLKHDLKREERGHSVHVGKPIAPR